MTLKVLIAIALAMFSQCIYAGGNTLVFSMLHLPSSHDHTDMHHPENMFLMKNVTEGLLTTGPQGELIAGHAIRHEVSEDGLTYKFYLRENAYWSSGKRVTAHDYVKSWQRLLDPNINAASKSLLKFLKNYREVVSGSMDPERLGILAESENVLVVNLKVPASFFVRLLTLPPLTPIPSYMEDSRLNDTLLGGLGESVSSGPFIIDSQSESEITMIKNPAYWGKENVFMEKIVFKKSKSFKSTVVNVVTGKADLAELWDVGEMPWVKANYSEYLKAVPVHGTEYYRINLDKESLGKNPLLREAMSMSIDRDKISKKILKNVKPAYNFVPSQMYREGTQALPQWLELSYQERIKKAKSMIEEIENQDGKIPTFSIKVKDDPDAYKVALSMKVSWEKIGLNIKLLKMKNRNVYKDIESGNYDIARSGWIADYDDPYSFLHLYGKDQEYYAGTKPLEQVDQLLEKAMLENDVLKRESLYVKIEDFNHWYNSILPVYHYQHFYVVAPNLRGVDAVASNYILKWAYRTTH